MGNSLMKDSMKTWGQAWKDGLVSGAIGSLASTVAGVMAVGIGVATSPLLLLSAVFGSLTLYVSSPLRTTSKPI